MGFQYMFFDPAPRDRFVAFASALGIPGTILKHSAGPVRRRPSR